MKNLEQRDLRAQEKQTANRMRAYQKQAERTLTAKRPTTHATRKG